MCETLYSICEQVISIFCNNILFVRVYCFLVNHRCRSVALWNNTVNMLKIVSNLRKGKSCVEQKSCDYFGNDFQLVFMHIEQKKF